MPISRAIFIGNDPVNDFYAPIYKALNPIVKVFFGFNTAAVTSIDVTACSFTIELVSDISADFGPSARKKFEGKFSFDKKNILTVIEIPHVEL